MIRLAPLWEIDAIWPHIAEGMKECCDRSGGDITPDWLFMTCRRGEALLLLIEDGDKRVLGALICRPEVWAGERVLRISGACGVEMARWIEELRAYREWPDMLGFSRAIFEGRKGWGAVPGVRVIRQVYEVDIGNGR